MNERPVLVAEDLHKSFPSGDRELTVLKGVNIEVHRGEILSIVGSSGVGKSTLLHILGALLRPSAGKVFLAGEDVFRLGDGELSRKRNEKIGFVFQFHHLLPEFTAEENVMLPCMIGNGSRRDARERARLLLESVSLGERTTHHPSELSGGEQQRVAVARALATSPDVVLADEPSGNLDEKRSRELHDLIWCLREKEGQAFVIVTHDEELANRADRKLRLHDGVLLEESGRAVR
jgi:lipoprotein-releasing system ATP-binding protein